ncbi:DUF6279 family lipoprotein [Thalassotalea sediminis]|uniref:DUF6279 family lipoprotein n=1 Tax=Thalassotalea sediminis TaxID=1759089 RepID=UPI002573DEAB|nr:DUF6279 family lipoprotein [Thalassotalea sediminis]
MFKRNILVLSFVALLTGCSTTFIYNHIDWWIDWYLDDYVDLNRVQQKAFDKTLTELHQWHRQTQLSRYLQQLTTFQTQVANGLTINDLKEHQQKVTGHWKVLMNKIAPEVAQLSTLLSKKQRNELIENIKEIRQKRIDDHEELSREEWLELREKEQIEELKEWVGKLTSTQKQKIHQLVQGFQTERSYWLTYRESWQQSFFELLAPEQLDQAYVVAFTDLMINGRERLRSEEFKSLTRKNDAITHEIFVTLLNDLTAKQRKKLNRKLSNLREDIMELIEDE